MVMRVKLLLLLVAFLATSGAVSFGSDSDWDNDYDYDSGDRDNDSDNDGDHDYGNAADYRQTYHWSDKGSCRDANGTNWQYSRNERLFENDVRGDTLTVREIHAVPDVDCRSYSKKSAAHEITGFMRDNPNIIIRPLLKV
jgi:hypothetical protein